jgi:hypothetical protein
MVPLAIVLVVLVVARLEARGQSALDSRSHCDKLANGALGAFWVGRYGINRLLVVRRSSRVDENSQEEIFPRRRRGERRREKRCRR